jgi:hypothetical protein
MKKNTLLLCSFLVLSCLMRSAYAQEYRGELNVMISDAIPTTLAFGLFDDLSETLKAAFGDYRKDTKDKSIPGMISVGYTRKVSHWLALGGDVGLTHFSSEVTLISNDGTKPNEHVDRKTTAFLIMPTGRFYYLQKRKLNLYGLVGAGAMFANKTETSGAVIEKEKLSGFAFQVNPIGVRVGERFGGFAELGFGMKGFATLGFSVKL